jgi:hypothetical protein
MGTSTVQGELWGAKPDDWTELGEPVSMPVFQAVFDAAGIGAGTRVLDAGCGAGGALAEARRVTRPGGSIGVCIWAPREECESVMHSFAPVLALLGPPPPAAGPPLTAPGVLETRLGAAGLEPLAGATVDIPFEFPDAATAWRCFSSAGIIVNVIRAVGEEAVRDVVMPTLEPFTRPDGSVLQLNRFRWVLARRA